MGFNSIILAPETGQQQEGGGLDQCGGDVKGLDFWIHLS